MNETHFHESTPEVVREWLEVARLSYRAGLNYRIRLVYGDVATGKSWGEEHDVEGYVGRSTGDQPIPILLHNSRSSGGGAILDHCIVRILKTDGRVLYQHPTYQPCYRWDWMQVVGEPTEKGEPERWRVKLPVGDWIAGFDTPDQARRWLDKMIKWEM